MKKEHISLYTTVTGNTVGYDIYTFGHGEKKLYIQGGVHGGEVTYFIFKKVYDFLVEHESRLTCQVALAPLINPRAWEQRMYHYTAGKFDWHKGKDWNRGYPGSVEGDLSARMSDIIFTHAIEYAECVDLHTARTSAPYAITTHANAKNALRDIGLPYTLYARHAATYAGSFIHACSEQGKIAYAVECGSHDSYEPEYIDMVSGGLIRRISAVCLDGGGGKLVPIGKAQHAHEQFFVEKVGAIRAPVSGFTTYLHAPYASVQRGDVLCTIAHGDDLARETVVRAPDDCVVLELSKTHTTTVGDELVRYIGRADMQPLDNIA
jgi:predicted deacylase